MKKAFDISFESFSKYRTELFGIAAVMIMIFHSIGRTDWAFQNYITDCNIGVEIFLFLSGVGLYFSRNSKKYSLKSFYIKRFLNVYVPAVIIQIVLGIAEGLIFGGGTPC